MKVIHIAGFSNTGKTTFIAALLPELEKRGSTAVVKHIGHHGYLLPEGKDTTGFFEAGAIASGGIDAWKSVLILQEHDLPGILETLCDMGVHFTVIEGFKEKPYPKVTIGNVPGASNVILEDPSVEALLAHLGEFADMVTPGGFSKEFQGACGAGSTVMVSTIVTPPGIRGDQIDELRGTLERLSGERGTLTIRIERVKNASTEDPQMFMIGICSQDPLLTIEAAKKTSDFLEANISPFQGALP